MPGINRRSFLGAASLVGLALPSGVAFPASEKAEASAPQTSVKLEALSEWDAQLGFALDPPVGEWRPQPSGDKNQSVFMGGGYHLIVDFTHPEPQLVTFRFRLSREDGHRFVVRAYSLKSRKVFTDIYQFWSYRQGPPETSGEFDVYTRGLASGDNFARTYAANTGIPLALCANREGRIRFAFGLLDQIEATGLRMKNYSLGLSERGEGLNYEFEFVKPVGYSLQRAELIDGAYFDMRGEDWFATLRQYSEWAERAGKIAVVKPPPVAFEPIWNSWYPFGFNITQESIEKNAEFCQIVGIKNVSIDAGYQDQLTGGLGTAQDFAQFEDYTGDWTADQNKFPDFRGLVQHIHQRGQIATVWVALFMVGRKTAAYQQVRGMLRQDTPGEDRSYLCPCHPDTPAYLARTFSKLARDYDLDGFWLDFMDGTHTPCRSSHPHFTPSAGEGYNACLSAVREALLNFKPNFLMETRMPMTNLNGKQFFNVMETTDMPFDLDLNRSLGVVVRSYAHGLACKIDPVQWHIRESDENVGVCCATTTLTGVPVFGVDFRLLPASHLRVVAAWTQFYRAHQSELWQGHFQPVGFGHLSPQLQVQGDKSTFLYLGSSATAPASAGGSDSVYLINASDQERVALYLDNMRPGRWQVALRNCYLEQVSATSLEVRTSTYAFDLLIPRGGLAELRKTS
ncbi:MAG: TIM-barrel domain-containing protein [Terriglobia bacterium]|jgi:alpha-galactosidase